MTRKMTYEALEKKAQKLEDKIMELTNEASKLKSIILSNVHHEIRTPLNAI